MLLTHGARVRDLAHGSSAEAFELAREYPPERMRIVQEGFRKEDRLDAAA